MHRISSMDFRFMVRLHFKNLRMSSLPGLMCRCRNDRTTCGNFAAWASAAHWSSCPLPSDSLRASSAAWPPIFWKVHIQFLKDPLLGKDLGNASTIFYLWVPHLSKFSGEFAYGALEGGAFDNGFSTAFYSAFAWIYLNQWFLYQKVNQLMEDVRYEYCTCM